MCSSAERLHLSSFGEFPHNKHLIDFPSSESLKECQSLTAFPLNPQSQTIFQDLGFLLLFDVFWSDLE